MAKFSNAVARIAIPLLMAAGGCASEQESARRALPAAIPASVDHWNGGKLDHVEFVHNFKLSDYSKVVVEACDTSGAKLPAKDSNTYAPVTTVLSRSTELLANGMRSKLNNIVTVETGQTPATGASKVLLVQTKIGEIEPGSAALRFWIGMGAGGAYADVEGQIVDSESGQTLLRFENGERRSDFLRDYAGLLNEEITATGQAVGILLEAFTQQEK